MDQFEFSLQNLLYAVLGLLVLGGLFALLRTLVKTPKALLFIDSLDCATRTVRGHSNTEEEPVRIEAFIYDNDGTTETPPLSEVTDFDLIPGSGRLDYVLRDVDAETMAGSVKVKVRFIYEDEDVSNGERDFPCGSGSGNVELLARRQAAPADQRVATTVPHRYSVPAPGFASAALQVFNREWSLVRQGGACGQVAWNNGGNGTTAPFVELSTIGLFGFEWELMFRSGDVSVRYSIPGNEWQALAANWLRLVKAEGVPDSPALPPQLLVSPA